MKRTKKGISQDRAIYLLLAGLFLGTIFTFGTRYWHAPVSREDCTQVNTEFVSYRERTRRGSIQLIYIDCVNGQRYEIDGACISQLVLDGVENLQPQEPITLLIHPNSDTILEFSSTSGTLMAFDDATQRVADDTLLFTALGILMYAAALGGLYNLIWQWKRQRSRKKQK